MRHTPGPWRLEPCSHGGAILRRNCHDQESLQIVPIEDANLIAAAPDLLEALIEAQQILDVMTSCGGLLWNPDPQAGSIAWKIRKAIEKATGK